MFLTDGKNLPESIPAFPGVTKQLKEIVDKIFAVGVGKINRDELKEIASQSSNVFVSPSFAGLDEVVQVLTPLSCEGL